ncbi:6-aminohexanoate-dimer hydrolase [Aureimonas sp. SA4125]|uniref:serine hydrolase domain-containing protein n=1 Tax=Aureimonas sp. SA4125 TaxID=2826993 RepID=UPI001CC7BEFF|nr:serine hydrolase [Aureimonas sp. SA4125]BDA82720.1 6-aminohexanoate-dimer hydrolase [Aureimonas sp. SA4125]
MQRYRIPLRTLAAATALGFSLAAVGSFPLTAKAAEESVEQKRAALAGTSQAAQALRPLNTLQVSVSGELLLSEGYRGHRTTVPANIKSASKSIVSALVGIAIDKGMLSGTDQKIAPLLKDELPADPDPRLAQVTIGNLLSMQAGLERTSGPNYGSWISSRNWVRAALAAPFVDDPGGSMLYSTGSTHLLSAILTRASGKSTLALSREWLGKPAGVTVTDWEQDPQGIYLGGNQMAMTPRSLLAFGELYRNGGRSPDGTQVIPTDWIAESWEPRTRSRFSGEAYGYGWFQANFGGYVGHYGWGYGGQMIYVIPDLALTVAITSDESGPSARTGYKDDLHRLVAEQIVPAIAAGRSTPSEG